MGSSNFPYQVKIRLNTRFPKLKLPVLLVKTNSCNLFEKLNKHRYLGKGYKKTPIFYEVKKSSSTLKYLRGRGFFHVWGPEDLGKLKTVLRNISFAKLQKKNFSLLHSVLVDVDGSYFALTGGSESGKTTYANLLTNNSGGKILSNDYLICSKKAEGLLVSDLNFEAGLKHEGPLPLSAILFCIPRENWMKNDVWQPQSKEFVELVLESHTCFPPQKSLKTRVRSFWKTVDLDQLGVFCINTRKRLIDRTNRDFTRVVRAVLAENVGAELKKFSVAVVGLGAVGAQVAFQLMGKRYIRRVYLYNRSKDRQRGLALDFSQASQLLTGKNKIIECQKFSECLKADWMVICIRETKRIKDSPKTKLEERMGKVLPHLSVFYDFAKEIRQVKYHGKILVVTNPVEILTWFLYEFSNLNSSGELDGEGLSTDQVYGVGLELDKARAELAAFKVLGWEAAVATFIQHGESLVLDTKSQGRKITGRKEAEILERTRGASAEIRKSVPRTVYGPSAAVVKTLEGIIGIRKTPIYLSAIYQDFVLGMPVEFKHQIPKYFLPKGKELERRINLWRDKFLTQKVKLRGSFVEES